MKKPSQRYRGILAYDGTHYLGFQRIPGRQTVQGALEDALAAVTQEAVQTLAAGRTDAGVHARGQVIAFDCQWRHEVSDLWRAINANLPRDIALQSLGTADENFHPRYDAVSREYLYQLYNAPVRNPIWDYTAWHIGATDVDLDTMQRAADLLIGVHDFASFGQPTTGEVTIRHLMQAAFSRSTQAETEGTTIYFRITANAFLRRMVRRIVGTLVQVGQGRLSFEEFEAAFRAADITRSGQAAPSCGLTLMHVNYDEEPLPEKETGEIKHEFE